MLSMKMLIALILSTILSVSLSSQEKQTTTLSNATSPTLSTIEKEKIINETDIYGNPVNRTEYCSKKPCIYKCCPIGQILKLSEPSDKQCVNDTDPVRGIINPDIYDKNMEVTRKGFENSFHLLIRKDIVENGVYLYPSCYICLMENGSLTIEMPNSYEHYMQTDFIFCLDHVIRIGENVAVVDGLVIIEDQFQDTITENSQIPDICVQYISSVFMAAVLAIYAYLPQLRNLQGKVLMAYLSSLMVAFTSVSTLQLLGKFSYPHYLCCTIFSFLNYYFVLAAFFWMNVMSFDIYWTFRGLSLSCPINRRGENHKFLMYCLYAYGCPLAMTIIFAILNYLPMSEINKFIITPGITEKGCFLPDKERWLYLHAPMSVLILANTVMFVLTIWNFCKVRRETKALRSVNSSTHKSTNRLILYVKVFLVMGLSWFFEAFNVHFPKYVTMKSFTEIFNQLMGVMMFVIFVCKTKIFKMIVTRYRSRNKTSNSTASRRNFSRSESVSTSSPQNIREPQALSKLVGSWFSS